MFSAVTQGGSEQCSGRRPTWWSLWRTSEPALLQHDPALITARPGRQHLWFQGAEKGGADAAGRTGAMWSLSQLSWGLK